MEKAPNVQWQIYKISYECNKSWLVFELTPLVEDFPIFGRNATEIEAINERKRNTSERNMAG